MESCIPKKHKDKEDTKELQGISKQHRRKNLDKKNNKGNRNKIGKTNKIDANVNKSNL